MQNQKGRRSSLFLAGIISLAMFLCAPSCADRDDSIVGSRVKSDKSGGLPQEIIIVPTLEETSFVVENVTTGFSDRIAVGDFQGVNARALFKFDFTFTEPESTILVSANMKLELVSKSGRETPVTIQAFRVTSDWDEASVTFIDAADGVLWMMPGGDFDPVPIAETVFDAEETDTLLLEIDSLSVVQAWGDSTDEVENFGVLLMSPDADSAAFRFSANILGGELGRPVMDFDFVKIADPDSILQARALTVDDAFIYESDGALPDSALRVGEVPQVITLLRFDFSPVPQNVTINLVQLILSVTDESPLGDNIGMRIFPVNGAWAGADTDIDDVPIDIAGLLGGAEIVTQGDSKDSLEIVVSYVRDIVNGERENTGIAIKSTPEGRDINAIDFHTSQAPFSQRPRIRIVFTQPPRPPVP